MRTKAEIEILNASDALRIEVRPKPSAVALAFEGSVLCLFAYFVWKDWTAIGLFSRILLSCGLAAALGSILYQLSGSETIEIDHKSLTISRRNLPFSRTAHYPVSRCSELTVLNASEDQVSGLQFKAGWKTVRFARYIDDEQADSIISELQHTLPDVAAQLLSSSGGFGSHFTTLNLKS